MGDLKWDIYLNIFKMFCGSICLKVNLCFAVHFSQIKTLNDIKDHLITITIEIRTYLRRATAAPSGDVKLLWTPHPMHLPCLYFFFLYPWANLISIGLTEMKTPAFSKAYFTVEHSRRPLHLLFLFSSWVQLPTTTRTTSTSKRNIRGTKSNMNAWSWRILSRIVGEMNYGLGHVSVGCYFGWPSVFRERRPPAA